MKGVCVLLFFGFFGLTKAVNSTQTLQQKLNRASFNCNVNSVNDTHLKVRCNGISGDALSWFFPLLYYDNITVLQLENVHKTGSWRLNQLPPFKCEVLKFVNADFTSIAEYAFVNVGGLTKLYFKNVPLTILPFFGHLPSLKTLGFSKVPLQQLTNHASTRALVTSFYGKRTFAGLLSLETLILRDTNLTHLTHLDIYDLLNLVTIEPQTLAPAGFVNHQGPDKALLMKIEREHSFAQKKHCERYQVVCGRSWYYLNLSN